MSAKEWAKDFNDDLGATPEEREAAHADNYTDLLQQIAALRAEVARLRRAYAHAQSRRRKALLSWWLNKEQVWHVGSNAHKAAQAARKRLRNRRLDRRESDG